MRKMMMASLALGATFVFTGCGHHYRQQQMAQFEQRIADRCVAAARSGQPQVVVVPHGGAAPAPATTIVVPQP